MGYLSAHLLAVADPALGGADTAVEAGFDSIQGFLTGTIAIAVFGFAVAALALVFGLKWFRKSVKGA